jgi:hypothetical protein
MLTAALSKGKGSAGHSASFGLRQVVEFANHFQKHSDLPVIDGKPLIDHALPPA